MTEPNAEHAAQHPRPKPRSGLGRGLNALMGDIAREEPVGGDVELVQRDEPEPATDPVELLLQHPDRREVRRDRALDTGREVLDDAVIPEDQRPVAQPGDSAVSPGARPFSCRASVHRTRLCL